MKMVHTVSRFGILSVFIVVVVLNVYTLAFAGGLTKITDGVYSYVDAKNPRPRPASARMRGIIIGKDGVVVVDTLTSAKEAQRVHQGYPGNHGQAD